MKDGSIHWGVVDSKKLHCSHPTPNIKYVCIVSWYDIGTV